MNHIKRFSLILLLPVFLLNINDSVKGQTSNAKMESVFIYNFTKLVNWPASYRSGDFVIGVLGNSPILNELKNMARTKKAGSQNIVIKKFSSPASITKCHIIFVPHSQTGSLGAVASKVSNYSTLIVAESPGAINKGAAINFVVVGNKQKFEIRESNATKYGLNVGAQLKNLGISK
jgi:hypothetical protein